LGIAYTGYYNSDHALRYAEYTCAADYCSWNISTIHMAEGMSGDAASLRYDGDGVPHIAFHRFDEATGLSEISYASYVGSGGDCGVHGAEGAWRCDTVQGLSGGSAKACPSLALGPEDTPRIAYLDAGVLWYAEAGAQDSDRGPDDTWSFSIVDNGAEAFCSHSLAVDDRGGVHVAYLGAGALKYAVHTGSSGNCADDAWGSWPIAELRPVEGSPGVALALDIGGLPIIAYQDGPDGTRPAALSVARPASALGLAAGNCGPVEGAAHTWWCNVVDPGGRNLEVGGHASIAIGPRGLATIAYYERDDSYATGRLKVATQRFWFYLPVVMAGS
jgi:hypothetical protein